MSTVEVSDATIMPQRTRARACLLTRGANRLSRTAPGPRAGRRGRCAAHCAHVWGVGTLCACFTSREVEVVISSHSTWHRVNHTRRMEAPCPRGCRWRRKRGDSHRQPTCCQADTATTARSRTEGGAICVQRESAHSQTMHR